MFDFNQNSIKFYSHVGFEVGVSNPILQPGASSHSM
jgi:hypothetical protein